MEKAKDLEIKTGCDRGLCRLAVGRQDKQLNTYDWLADVPGNTDTTDLVEVQFKHTRKGYYHNVNNLELKKGDIVAVEANMIAFPVTPNAEARTLRSIPSFSL